MHALLLAGATLVFVQLAGGGLRVLALHLILVGSWAALPPCAAVLVPPGGDRAHHRRPWRGPRRARSARAPRPPLRREHPRAADGLRRASTGDFGFQLDIAPTIVDLLGLPIPEPWQGRSLLRAEPDRCAIIEAVPFHDRPGIRGVLCRQGGKIYKYLHNSGRVALQPRTELLFELITDPDERRDLSESHESDRTARMRARLQRYRDGHRSTGRAGDPPS